MRSHALCGDKVGRKIEAELANIFRFWKVMDVSSSAALPRPHSSRNVSWDVVQYLGRYPKASSILFLGYRFFKKRDHLVGNYYYW